MKRGNIVNNTISGSSPVGTPVGPDPLPAKKTAGNRFVRKIKSQKRLAAAFEKRIGPLKKSLAGDRTILQKIFKVKTHKEDNTQNDVSDNSERLKGLKKNVEGCCTQAQFKYYLNDLLSMFPGDENLSKIEGAFLSKNTTENVVLSFDQRKSKLVEDINGLCLTANASGTKTIDPEMVKIFFNKACAHIGRKQRQISALLFPA